MILFSLYCEIYSWIRACFFPSLILASVDKSVSGPVTRPGSVAGFCLDLCSLCLTALEIFFSYLKLEGSLFKVNFCCMSETQTGQGVQRKRCQWGKFTRVQFLLCLVEAARRSWFWGSVSLGRCPFQACPVAVPDLPPFTTVLCAGDQPPRPPRTGVSFFVPLILCGRVSPRCCFQPWPPSRTRGLSGVSHIFSLFARESG